nr:hypothetical protein [Lachnospiraceae bacterium]
MDNQNISRKNRVFIFMLGYVLFFISLFIRDVGWDNINELSKVIRLASYTIIALNILVSNRVHIKELIYT